MGLRNGLSSAPMRASVVLSFLRGGPSFAHSIEENTVVVICGVGLSVSGLRLILDPPPLIVPSAALLSLSRLMRDGKWVCDA